MSGRVRKPTARALESAESAALVAAAPPARKRAPGPSSSSHPSSSLASAAPVKRNGRAINDKGQQAIAHEQALASQQMAMFLNEGADLLEDGDDSMTGQEPDLTLYCVCLGYDTGEQPMIQCEHCSNWFHFNCVGLTDESAARIEAYSCEMCEQMGMGSTRFLVNDAPPPPVTDAPPVALPLTAFENIAIPPLPLPADGQDGHYDLPTSGEEDDDDEEEEEDDDDDFEADSSAKKRKRAGGEARKRRKIDDEASDDDYDSEDDADGAPKPSRKKKPAAGRRRPSAPRQSLSDVKPTGPAPSVPPTDRTRAAVIKQLVTLFSSIFSASSDGTSAGIDVRAAALAEEVEGELFEAFSELDDKGYRAPRVKYASKFRSLAYNLKTNAVLRSRVAGNELTPHKIANLTADDLQTPELRAMAESVRAASLRNSVKEVLAVPTTKFTHKGEQEIDNGAAALEAVANEERAARKKEANDNSDSTSHADSPAPVGAGTPSAASPAATPGSPGVKDSPSAFPSFGTPRHRSSLPTSAHPFSFGEDSKASPRGDSPALSSKQGSPAPAAGSPAARAGSPDVVNEVEGEMSPPPPPAKRNSAANFDMASIWSKAQSGSPPLASGSKFDSPMPVLEDMTTEGQQPESYDIADPFDAIGKADDDDDFDEDDLFREPGSSPRKKTPRTPPPKLEERARVWSGDVLVPEEGGFPSFAVQVGGRPLGADPSTWRKLLPQALTTAGRIGSGQALKYLVECSFSPKRELVVLALFPDLSGPSAEFPHKPVADRCSAKHRHIFDQYVKRDRIGVVQPPKELRELVRDVYIVPLRKDDPLPEYLELAEEHVVPEKGTRRPDLLFAVLVIQKGVLPTVKPAPPPPTPAPVVSEPPAPPPAPRAMAGIPTGPRAMTNPTAPSHAGFPPSSSQAPAFDPSSVQSLLQGMDPSTLSSLLANPALQSALGGAPPPSQLEGGGHGSTGGAPGMHPARLAMMNQGYDSSLSSGATTAAGGHGEAYGTAPSYGGNEAFGTGDGGWGARAGEHPHQQQQHGQQGYHPGHHQQQQHGGWNGGYGSSSGNWGGY
ncbi:hypothetical protein JCM10207_006625 [Rhodosporidiobolus poonsookiae]